MINTTLGENVKGTSLTTSLLYCEKLTMPLEKFDLTDIEKFFWLEKALSWISHKKASEMSP